MSDKCAYEFNSSDVSSTTSTLTASSGYDTLRRGNELIEFADSMSTMPTNWECPRDTVGDLDHCPFHLSPEKREEMEISDSDLKNKMKEEIENSGNNQESINFIGSHFSNLDLNGIVDSKGNQIIEFADTIIEGDLDLSSTVIRNSVSFRQSRIDGNVILNQLESKQSMDFSWSIIGGSFNAFQSEFKQSLNLNNIVIKNTVEVVKSEFLDDMSCRDSFIGDFTIITGNFGNDIQLSGTVFCSSVQFSTDMSNTKINRNLNLSKAGIGGTLEVSDIQILNDFIINNCIIGRDLNANAIFVGDSLLCEESYTLRQINLNEAVIHNDCKLSQPITTDSNNKLENTDLMFKFFHSYLSRGPYQLKDINVGGDFVLDISNLAGDPPIIDLRNSNLESGILKQSNDSKIIYDLEGSDIGNIEIEGHKKSSAFELCNFSNVSFNGFDFRQHYEELKKSEFKLTNCTDNYKDKLLLNRALIYDPLLKETLAGHILAAVSSNHYFDDMIKSSTTKSEFLDNIKTDFSPDNNEENHDVFQRINTPVMQGICQSVIDEIKENNNIADIFVQEPGRSALQNIINTDFDRAEYLKFSNKTYPLQRYHIDIMMRFYGLLRYLSGAANSEKVTFLMNDVPVNGDHFANSELVDIVTKFANRNINSSNSQKNNNGQGYLNEYLHEDSDDWISQLLTESMFQYRFDYICSLILTNLPEELLSHKKNDVSLLSSPEIELYNSHSQLLYAMLYIDSPNNQDLNYSKEIIYRSAKIAADSDGENKASREFFIKELVERKHSHLEKFRNSKSYKNKIKHANSYIGNATLFFVSGYGEKSSYVVISSIFIIFLFAALYSYILPFNPYGSMSGNLILSVESFVALVHSGGVELSGHYRALTQVQGFIGAFMIALFVVTLSRTVKR